MTAVKSKETHTGTILAGQRLTVDATGGTALVDRLSGSAVVETTAVSSGSAVFGEYLRDFQFRVTCLTGAVTAVVDQSTAEIDEVDAGFANPMTTAGDLIKGGVSGAAARLANPGAGTFALQSIDGVLTWTAVV